MIFYTTKRAINDNASSRYPEDFIKDQYILKPLIEAMLIEIGKPHAKVTVCQDPRLAGTGQALQWKRINEIIERYKGMFTIFLLCVDRDGDENRRAKLDNIESEAKKVLPASRILFAENAWQEVEIWALAGCKDLPGDWQWLEVRNEVSVKQKYFDPYSKQRNLQTEPHQGRGVLGAEAAREYNRVRGRCDEVLRLETRIKEWLATDL